MSWLAILVHQIAPPSGSRRKGRNVQSLASRPHPIRYHSNDIRMALPHQVSDLTCPGVIFKERLSNAG